MSELAVVPAEQSAQSSPGLARFNEILHGTVTAVGYEMTPGMSFEDWLEDGEVLKATAEASLWQWADWWIQGDHKYGERAAQAELLPWAYQTLKDAGWVCRKIERSRRRDPLPLSFHKEVAVLPPVDQDDLLDECIDEAWTRKELRQAVRRKKNSTPSETEPPPLPAGQFDVLYVDPPWRYDFAETDSRQIENQYPTMSQADLCALKVPAADNALLLLWATAPKLAEALEVMAAWGFEYKTHAIWDKGQIGMGYWFRGQHELLLVGTQGVFSPPLPEDRQGSVYCEDRGRHSPKPAYFYEWIERAFPSRAYCELFARQTRDGWTAWGNQV